MLGNPKVDFECFFNTLPKMVHFSLAPKFSLPRAVCWLANKEYVPQATRTFRKYLGISRTNIEQLCKGKEAVSMPFLRRLTKENPKSSVDWPVWEYRLYPMADDKGVMLYLLSETADVHVAGYITENTLSRWLESIWLLDVMADSWIMPPHTLGSGDSPLGLGENLHENEYLPPDQPWNFEVLYANSKEELHIKAASLLAQLHSPYKLWTVCIEIVDNMVHMSLLTLVTRGMRQPGEKMLEYSVVTAPPPNAPLGHPLYAYFFWQTAVTGEKGAE